MYSQTDRRTSKYIDSSKLYCTGLAFSTGRDPSLDLRFWWGGCMFFSKCCKRLESLEIMLCHKIL